MKYLLLIIIVIIYSTSCANKTEGKRESGHNTHTHHETVHSKDNPLMHLKLKSQKDTVCGMHLTANVADTTMINGKIYGFCSQDCKQEFVHHSNSKK